MIQIFCKKKMTKTKQALVWRGGVGDTHITGSHIGGDAHITSDMCTGIHISRGYTYPCEGTHHVPDNISDPLLSQIQT